MEYSEETQQPVIATETIPTVDTPVNSQGADLIAKALKEYEQEFNQTNKHTTQEQPSNIEQQPTTATGTPTVEAGTAKKSLTHLIKGKHAVNLLDLLIPALLVFTINLIGYRIGKDKLKLDKEEKETLTPFVEDFLQAIELDMNNPYHNLFIGLGIVYGAKIVDAIPAIKKGRGRTEDAEVIEERTDITEQQDVPSIVLFEQEYNAEIERVMREKEKGTLGARKWLADHEPQKIKFLMTKYGVQDDKYLMYSNIYKKEKEAAKYNINL